VQTRDSKKGRPRKVIDQGKAKIAFTGKAATSQAGMSLISRALEHFSVSEDLQKLSADLDLGKHHRMSSLLEQLVALRMMGGEAISDTALLRDQALVAFFEWDEIAHPSTFGRRLGEMRWAHNLGLERIVTGLSERVRKDGLRLVAIDSTVVSVFGEKIEGAERGYNPHKPGRDCYHPLLAVDVGTRAVVDGYLRPGSCGTGHGLDGFIRKLVAESRHAVEETVFRMDKGLTSGAVLDTLEGLGARYVAKLKLTPTVAGKISRIRKWRAIGKGHFAANIYCQLDGWSRPRRMAVIERNQSAKEQPSQLPLFEMMEGRYEVVVTNLHLNAENIWRLYNRGTVVEQVIEELKNDVAAAAIRTNSFWANDALFLTGLIAYNLLNCIRRLGLPKALQTARLKRLSFLLLQLPANVIRRSRQLWVKIKRDHPMRLVFYQAMAALQ
jgi:Transposase DDE domain group 1